MDTAVEQTAVSTSKSAVSRALALPHSAFNRTDNENGIVANVLTGQRGGQRYRSS